MRGLNLSSRNGGKSQERERELKTQVRRSARDRPFVSFWSRKEAPKNKIDSREREVEFEQMKPRSIMVKYKTKERKRTESSNEVRIRRSLAGCREPWKLKGKRAEAVQVQNALKQGSSKWQVIHKAWEKELKKSLRPCWQITCCYLLLPPLTCLLRMENLRF